MERANARGSFVRRWNTLSTEALESQRADPSAAYDLAPDFAVEYPQLKSLLCIGGVYIAQLLSQPAWQLRDPRAFLEALLYHWVHLVESNTDHAELDEPSQALVVLLQANPALSPHVAAMGYPLKAASGGAGRAGGCAASGDAGERAHTHTHTHSSHTHSPHSHTHSHTHTHTPRSHTHTHPLTHTHPRTHTHTLPSLPPPGHPRPKRLLGGRPRDALLDCVKPLLAAMKGSLSTCTLLLPSLNSMASAAEIVEKCYECRLVPFVLGLLSGGLEQCDDPSAVKAHAVKLLKTLAADPRLGATIQAVLDEDTVWDSYSAGA